MGGDRGGEFLLNLPGLQIFTSLWKTCDRELQRAVIFNILIFKYIYQISHYLYFYLIIALQLFALFALNPLDP